MRRRLPGWIGWPSVEPALLVALLLVMGAGLFVLYSASGQDAGTVYRQGLRLGVGVLVMLAISQLPPYLLRQWTPWLYGAGLLLLGATAWLGEGVGARRWLDLGLVRFQPSEIMKLAVPMMVAAWLHGRVLPPGWRDALVAGAILGLPALLIARQPDLGTALLIGASGCFTLFLAGLSWRMITATVAALVAATPAVWLVMHEYQRDRVRTFLNPEADPLGQGWNIIQSKVAVGSGGFAGKGWLNGTQSQLEFIPERNTDFILAVLSEEFGFFGVAALFALYLYIAARCLWIAGQARDSWSRLVTGSLALTLFVYVLVNGGMVSGVLPVVGVPLPLISYGGTSAVTLLAGFGIVMSVYGHRNFIR